MSKVRYGSDFNPRGDRATTDYIVIHCSAGPDNGTARGVVHYHMVVKGWLSGGYHFVSDQKGRRTQLLALTAIGAHVGTINREPGQPGWNSRAIGICLIGGLRNPRPDAKLTDNYSPEQIADLRDLVITLWRQFGKPTVTGHHNLIAEFGAKVPKACPCFDVPGWWADVEASLELADAEEPIAPPAPLRRRRSGGLLRAIVDLVLWIFRSLTRARA